MFSDGFGNTFLDRLQEISLPEPAAWTPQTAGWYVLAALLVLGLAWWARGLVRRRAANRYRRAALAEMAAIQTSLGSGPGSPTVIADIAALLKRTALAAFPRVEVAGLSGEAWLGFLDASARTTEFSRGPGRLLADRPYRPATALPVGEAQQLLALSRRWIKTHRRPDQGR